MIVTPTAVAALVGLSVLLALALAWALLRLGRLRRQLAVPAPLPPPPCTDLAEQMDGLVRDLRRSNEELEQFAYAVSHDLRQPLRTVQSYVALVEDSLKDSLDPETREFMTFIRDGASRMDALIIGLLDYSRVGRMAQDGPVPVGHALDLALSDLEKALSETGAQVVVAPDLPVVMGDLGELTRLFQNLIGNAVKYRRPDQPPHVVIGGTDQGDVWCFSVADNGIGIAPEHAERIFGIFQRLHPKHAYEGTGIGLAICRKMVERHGGRIWVKARPNGGSEFCFSWPKAPGGAGP